ncbi:hypothetical protein C2G38_2176797 [Gigaspora rosea]|uniref:Uncharacterized protein n=1 Tax=Gigaspora rosea TaxID=44941 RepID=A0A397VJ42_9GLOM|nr:hypothetical protein C2G38_2176797 [Gigaspora rosea]
MSITDICMKSNLVYFLNENINSHDKLTAQEMYYSFQEFVLSEEVKKEDVLSISTIIN